MRLRGRISLLSYLTHNFLFLLIGFVILLCVVAVSIYYFFIKRRKEAFTNGEAASLNANNTTYTLYYIASHNGRYLFDAKKLDAPKFIYATRGKENLSLMMNNNLYALKSVSLERNALGTSGSGGDGDDGEFLDVQLDMSNQPIQTLTFSPPFSNALMTGKSMVQVVVFS